MQAPQMMQTNERQVFSRLKESIQTGKGISLESDFAIRIGTILWDFAEAPTWNGEIPRLLSAQRGTFAKQIARFLHENGPERDSGLFTAWQEFSGEVQQMRRCDSPYVQAFREGLYSLDTAMRGGRAQDVFQASNRLLGLGPGLTPAGDDFLLGCLATWRSFGIPLSLLYQGDDCLAQIKRRTTTVSYFMLEQCLQGFVNDAFVQLFEKQELEAFLNIGSTSGVDMLIGAMFSMQHI